MEVYDEKRNRNHGLPSPTLNLATLNTRAQIDAQRTLPLFGRPKAVRIAFWRDQFTGNHLAFHLASSRDVVDIK